ncbi:MAG: hypothetical protein H7A51_09255 [Akkermansiaceae bacterium]|nr:hypothetical protein [Akkermansiaceae bacterium]
MIKTITKIGNSRGIILDSALLELANLKEGDKVNVTVHDGGTITLAPDVALVSAEKAKTKAAEIIAANDELFDRLSK